MTARSLVTLLAALLLWATPVGTVHAEQLSSLFERGTQAALQGQYQQAIEDYAALVDAGVQDVDVYYNLGNAHARLGQLGYAVLYLERAALIEPGDDDVTTALSAVREALGKRTAEKEGEALVRTRPPLLDALVQPLDEAVLAWTLLALVWLTFLALILRTLPAIAGLRLTLGVVAAVAAVLGGATGTALLVRNGSFQEGRRAVVVAADATLREGPDEKAQSRGPLAEGGLAHVVAREGRWVRLRTDHGLDGWTPADAVGLVRVRN